MRNHLVLTFLLCLSFTLVIQAKKKKDEKIIVNWKSMPAAPSLSPEESLKSFSIAPGFEIELIASEPALVNPVTMSWDGNGRLWVVQMTAYMPNVLGEGEEAGTGKVTVLEDTNGDGKMDKHTVFLDGLTRPRAIAHVKGGVLISEPPTLWFCEDTDGDLICDNKTNIGQYAKAGPPEHTDNGLIYGLDNWMYNAKSKYRHKFIDGKLIKEPAKFRGQWGIVQDNYGRLYSTTNSNYGSCDWKMYNQEIKVQRKDNSINSTRLNYGINRGYRSNMLKKNGTLNKITAISAPAIYRDNFYGKSFMGGYFVPEPAANALVYFEVKEEGESLIFDHKKYKDSKWGKREFLTSSDERFRPISIMMGPDSCIYIVDLYHGILQHLQFVTQDYLGKQIIERKLDQGNLKGRIYRIKPKGKTLPNNKPNMLNENPQELIKHLSHNNGWWRDTAQRLLVQHNDKSVIPLLKDIVLQSQNHLAKIHALWTLQGMNESTTELLNKAKKDKHPKVALTANLLSDATLLKRTEEKFQSNYQNLNDKEKELYKAGEKVYSASCFGCHQPNGQGMPNLAPQLAGSDWMRKPNKDLIKIVLHGLADPITINGKVYKNFPVMPGHSFLSDKNISDVITYIRNTWGNKGDAIAMDEVAKIRKMYPKRTATWTEKELSEK